MNKKAVALGLFLVVLVSSAFSFEKWRDSIYEQIRTETIKGLKDSFKKNISVGDVDGIIAGQVVFHDVVIPDFARAKQVKINFNPAKFLLKKDIVPAITTITIIGGEFEVKRQDHGSINALNILPPADPKAPPAPPFRAKLVFKDCAVNYTDETGFRRGSGVFKQRVQDVNGYVSFRRKDRLSLDLSGQTYDKVYVSRVKVTGSNDLKTGKYVFNISADKLGLEKWGNYTLPFEPIVFSSGTADLDLKLASPRRRGWPVSVVGKLSFQNGAAVSGNYRIDKVNGNLSVADDALALKNLSLELNSLPVVINGRYYDFNKQNLDFKIAVKKTDLAKLVALFPETAGLDLKGRGSAEFSLRGTAGEPRASGAIAVQEGRFYNQLFSGNTILSFEKQVLVIDVPDLSLYDGKLSGRCTLDFSRDLPGLSLAANLKNLDLAAVSQQSPGIEGRADGQIQLSGPVNELKGELSANLRQALLFGQPISHLSSRFAIQDGDIQLEHFSAASKNASVVSSGRISRDLRFDFQTKAQGIRLAGKGLLGTMEATVNLFQGKVSWQLNDEFLASPLKNLQASGEASLSRGRIGQQEFDLAQGQLAMGQGLIMINNVLFAKNSSLLQAEGQTGIGFPTRLKLTASGIDLADLKILNYVLPKEAKDPQGTADIKVEISGLIPKETSLTSFDPLLDLSATGEVKLGQVNVADIPITSGLLHFSWKKRALHFEECGFTTPDSNLNFEAVYGPGNKIKGSATGIVDFYTFRRFTDKYGKIKGTLGLSLDIDGSLDNPDLAASFWLEEFNFNELDLDEVEGSAVLFQNRLILPRPLIFTRGQDEMALYGTVDLNPLRSNQPENCRLDLELDFIEADLASTAVLFEKVRIESARKLPAPAIGGKVRIDRAGFSLPVLQEFIKDKTLKLYSANGEKNYFLRLWEGKAARALPDDDTEQETMGGELSGSVSVKGRLSDLLGTCRLEVRDGFFRDYTFDSLKAEASLAQQKLKIEKLELAKKRGRLSVTGEAELDGRLDLGVTARNMPLDILRTIFNKEFKGDFNLAATINGTVHDPNFAAGAVAEDVTMEDIDFDKISCSITKRNGHIYIDEFSLLENNKLSGFKGLVRLSAPGLISLEAEFQDDAHGLLNLLTDQIKWKKGRAATVLTVHGPLDAPEIKGRSRVTEGIIYVKAIDSNIIDVSGEASVDNSRLVLKSLTGIWKGKTSKSYPNHLGLAGIIDLSRILAKDPLVQLDLAFSPTQLYADLPNLYTGAINLDEARLSGPLYFDLSQGPKLSGQAEINNAVITLTRQGSGRARPFPLDLDLLLKLERNTYAVMGDIATFDLSNIFMNLEIKSDELKVSGSLAYPSLLGKLLLKRGTVTIFNREFSLLTADQQKTYYPYQSEKVKENSAVFTGEKGAEGALPNVAITAKVEVEDQQETEDGETINKKVFILSRLSGVIGGSEGLDISFDSFTADESNQLAPASYSEQDIKVMLLPDFIKSLTGAGKGENVDTNVVVADYLSSRVQTFLFRGIERDLEQRLGLESLTLEYNFGKDVRQAIGVTEQRVLEGERPDWRVGFVKGFFDKFYVDVNYSQFGREAETAQQLFNYELTYKLSPIWSIIYYREPISLQEIYTGNQKITLKAGFSFW